MNTSGLPHVLQAGYDRAELVTRHPLHSMPDKAQSDDSAEQERHQHQRNSNHRRDLLRPTTRITNQMIDTNDPT
jgi:hypothetical protein